METKQKGTVKIIGGYAKTNISEEDFALTPYLALVISNKEIKLFGISLNWGLWAIYITVGINIPKGFPRFHNISQ